jgi:3-hydroxyisobutyrate dehydrogenase-like beta-hydroxyacid dehydrogenase
MAQVGFIGLGTMGNPLCSHIVESGHNTTILDVRREAMEQLVERGATPAETPEEVGANADYVFLSLPNTAIVEEVVLGSEGLINGMEEGDILIDLSTIMPEVAKALSEEIENIGGEMLSAPVSRGPRAAKKGSSSVIVGGPKQVVDDCSFLLEEFSEEITHVGERTEDGAIVKVLNNYLGFTAMVATSEAVALGIDRGVEMENMLKAINKSSGRNSATERKFPDWILSKEKEAWPAPNSKHNIIKKDIGLYTSMAENSSNPALVGQMTSQIISLVQAFYGPGHQSDIYRFFYEMMNE